MIFDYILFNDEFDLLELRLEYMYSVIDRFIIVEAEFTFSGKRKELLFHKNKERFEKYLPKISHFDIPFSKYIQGDPWGNEYYQRNYLNEANLSIKEDDIVIISDTDEIVNIEILTKYTLDKPYLVELPVYYYHLNLKSSSSLKFNLITPYRYIKNINIGNRNNYFNLTNNIISISEINTGWHFSYLFGNDIAKYQKKISSFSHTEYDTFYYQNSARISACIRNGIDLFERSSINYHFINYKKAFTPGLISAIKYLKFDAKYLSHRKFNFSSINDIRFLIRLKYKPLLKKYLSDVWRRLKKI